LLVPFLWFGVKAGWNQADSDFPNYYVSAHLLLQGNLHEAYDVALFNKHIKTYNNKAQGLFVMYPPSTALVALPLTYFNILIAKNIWMIISMCALLGMVFLLSKLLAIDKIDSTNLILASGFNLYNDFMLGQVYVVMLFFVLLGWYCLIKNNEILSGLSWGFAAAIKFLPLFFIPFLLYKKQYKISLIIVTSFLMIHAFTFFLGGSMAYESFFEVFKNNYLHGQVANDIATSIQYQSVEVFFNLSHQFYSLPIFLVLILKIIWKIAWIALSTITCFKYLKTKYILMISLATVSLLLLLFENGSASYHLLFCLFILAIFLQLKMKLSFKIALIIAFAAMGFVPFMVQQLHLDYLFLNFSRLWCLSLFAALFFIGLNKQYNFLNK